MTVMALEKSIEPIFVRGFDESEISDETLEAIEGSEPSEWVIMKEVSLPRHAGLIQYEWTLHSY